MNKIVLGNCVELMQKIPDQRIDLMSGKDTALPPHPPLRTVRASFPAYGSSLSKAPHKSRLHYG